APRELDDRLAPAELQAARRLELVTERAELIAGGVGDRRLEEHARSIEVTEAGGVDRLLQVHAEHQEIEQQLRMTLRLHRAAHQAEAHPRFVALAVGLRIGRRLRDETWNQRVERALPRRDRIRQPRLERESRAAVL